MRRRALLASTAASIAAIAGCASLSANEGSPANGTDTTDGAGDGNGTDGGNGSDDGPEDPFDESTSVVELETGPRTLAFANTGIHTDDGASVQLAFDRTATADHPARLAGTLRNENDYANTFEIEEIPAVGTLNGEMAGDTSEEVALYLAPTKSNDLASTVPPVHRNQNGYWQTERLNRWIEPRRRLEPGEELRLEYRVVGDAEMPGLPTGTYEFRGDDRTVGIAAWNTDEPGPSEESRFAGRSVPPVHEEATIQWFHEADESTQTYLRPGRERVELDAAIDFELVNNSRESVGCGHWNLHKLVDGEWFHVGPMAHTADCRLLGAGARKEWTLRAFDGEPVPCDDGSFGRDGQTLGYLGGGTYGVVAGYGHPADRSGALLELVGEPVELALTDEATVERSDGDVVVTTAAHDDGEHPPDATLAVERIEGAGGDGGERDGTTERVIAETLMAGQTGFSRTAPLRNALAAFEGGVELVRVRTDENAVSRAIGEGRSTRRILFRGQLYELAEADTGR